MPNKFCKLPTSISIDPATELEAIISFVKQTWVIPAILSDDDFEKMVTVAFNAGLEVGATWFDNTDFSLEWYTLWDRRMEFLDAPEAEGLYFYDGWKYLIDCVSRGHTELSRMGKAGFRYEALMNPIISEARKTEGASKVAPQGYGKYSGVSYKEIRDDFEDHDCLGYWDDGPSGMARCDFEEDLFRGHTFETAGTFPMVGRIALHYVLQSDVNQGRGPLRELLSAITTQGINVAEWNNSAGAKELIPGLLASIPNEFAPAIPELPDNEFIRRCYEKGVETQGPFQPLTPEIAAANEKSRTEWDLLSDDEKSARKVACAKSAKELLAKELLAKIIDDADGI